MKRSDWAKLIWVVAPLLVVLALALQRPNEPRNEPVVFVDDMISINDCAQYCARKLMEQCESVQNIRWR